MAGVNRLANHKSFVFLFKFLIVVYQQKTAAGDSQKLIS